MLNLAAQAFHSRNGYKQFHPKVIWEECIATPKSLGLQRDAQIHLKTALSPSKNTTTSNKYTHPSTDHTHHLNGIQVQSALLPQFTFQTNRQTDRQMG